MHIEEHCWFSERLQRDMSLKVYGHAGKSCLVIPSQNGKHNDYEGFGMVAACSPWIDEGRLRLFCVDTIDEETVSCTWKDPRQRIEQHERWVQYLMQEVWPLMKQYADEAGTMVTGCSMGAYHAGNLFFRFPDRFDAVICLSGMYDAGSFMGGYMDGLVYLNSPCHSLSNMPVDHPYMDLYQNRRMFFCVGQGAWEDALLAGTRQLDGILKARGIPAWVDYWGYDVNHDWNWWQKQIAYFLGKLL